jgi:Arc/MetJ family transcription regulator
MQSSWSEWATQAPGQSNRPHPIHTHNICNKVYDLLMGRTNIVLDDELVRKARKLTRLKTKREIVGMALELLVRSESRKGILRYYGNGIWKGDLKRMRRNRS